MYSSKLVKRIQARLKSKSIVKDAASVRELLENLKYSEKKDSPEYFWKLYNSHTAPTVLQELDVIPEQDSTPEEINKELLQDVVKVSGVNLSSEEVEEVLENIKNEFDNQVLTLEQIKTSIRSYLVSQSQKKDEMLDDIGKTVLQEMGLANAKLGEVVKVLAVLKEENEELANIANTFGQGYKKSLVMRNRLVVLILVLAGTMLGVVPFGFKYASNMEVDFIKAQCSSASNVNQIKPNICKGVK